MYVQFTSCVYGVYTDHDIYEEKCNLNLSPLQTTKKNATFKISEKVNCDHYKIELRKDSLRRHIKTKHQKEEPSCVCVDIENAIFMVPKNNKHQCYPLHVQKKKQKHTHTHTHNSTDPCFSCESNFCMNYMSMSAKSGLKNELCRHLGQVVAAKTSFPELAVLLDKNFGFLVTW